MQNGTTTNTEHKEKKFGEKPRVEEIKDSMTDLADHASDYVRNFYRLQVLNLTKKATDITANAAGALVSIVLALFVLFFAGVALAWWLGDLIESRAGGFLIVAGFFALLALIFMAIRKKLVFPMFRNKIIRKMYE